jgi:hypothetical protein
MTIKLQKVRAGFYRCGRLCIHRGRGNWGIYDGPKFLAQFGSLGAVRYWISLSAKS